MSSTLKDKKRVIGFNYAWEGIIHVIKTERNFKIDLVAAILVLVAGFFLKLQISEWIAVIIVIGLVLVAEMINTAIELIIDYIKPEIHPSAKAIKDVAAGAVMIATIIAVIIGSIIFIPKLFQILLNNVL